MLQRRCGAREERGKEGVARVPGLRPGLPTNAPTGLRIRSLALGALIRGALREPARPRSGL